MVSKFDKFEDNVLLYGHIYHKFIQKWAISVGKEQ